LHPEANELTKQIFSIPLGNDQFLVYAPLKGMAFIANPALVNLVLDHCQRLDLPEGENGTGTACLQLLQQRGFFSAAPLPVDDYSDRGVCYDAAILFLTNRCNLRCSYCYASSGDFAPREMKWETARAAIDYVIKDIVERNSGEFTLGFHGGGEPTLNWKILTKATDYARAASAENGLSLQVSGAFNGYWSKKVLNYIIANFTDISLSFDGLPAVQNQQRPAVGHKESCSRVSETLAALDRSDLSYGIRMTVTSDSVAFLSESVAYICDRFRPRRIQVEPVFLEGRARQNQQVLADPGVFVEQFITGYRIAADHGIELFYSGARPDALTQRFCLAACRALVVTTEGDITTCFETYGQDHPLSREFIVGSYQGDGRFLVDRAKLDTHLRRTVNGISHCDACFCKWHCAGDCTVKTGVSGHAGEFQPTDRCIVNQELTRFLILDRLRASGGLLWEKNKNSSWVCGRRNTYG
jgi:uncharacterized protein